ncbi:NAD(P)H-dependent oxidoreductase subunit E, partial [Escherichia sp. R-CC3]
FFIYTAPAVQGSLPGSDALEKKLNIKPGQTTFDGRFTLLPTCCLGNCDKGPNMMIDEDTHAHLTPEAIPELLERYK